MRFVVLGSTGMLGSEVSRLAKDAGLDCIEISRSEGISFDATLQPFSQLAENLGLSSTDFVVNCIGWIPQKASGAAKEDSFLARYLNERLPKEINESAERIGFGWLQIATDCVFSGSSGGYVESSPKDATDLYGLTKIAGEQGSSGAMQIRSSIIGPDNRTHAGLYSWFLSHVRVGKTVTGYQNHSWNGVSTTAFARLAVGMAMSGAKAPFATHWIPVGLVSKFELLRMFASNLGLREDTVAEGMGPRAVNRTLTTLDPARNRELWRIAGYHEVPTIQELVAEFVAKDKN